MASCWIDFDGSGTTNPMSSSITLPKPWQVGHAPNGLLNENRRGCGTSYWMRHERHSKRSLNSWTVGSPPPSPPPFPPRAGTSTANAVPPPSA